MTLTCYSFKRLYKLASKTYTKTIICTEKCISERYNFSLLDIPGKVVNYERLQTIKAEMKKVLWYHSIEHLFALLSTTKHRINTSKSLQGLFSLDLSDRISCNILLHVAYQFGLSMIFKLNHLLIKKKEGVT